MSEGRCGSWCNTHNCQSCGEPVVVVTDAGCTDEETGLLCQECQSHTMDWSPYGEQTIPAQYTLVGPGTDDPHAEAKMAFKGTGVRLLIMGKETL